MNARWKVPPAFDFSKVPPGRYDGFAADLLLLAVPLLFAALGTLAAFAVAKGRSEESAASMFLFGMAGLSFGCFVQVLMKYRGTFLRTKIMRCLSELNVSHMRPLPVMIQGVFTGRLSAGMPWADDYVLQDESGFVACVLHQPLKFLEFIWGWMYSQRFVGREVLVYGWYRRFGAPFIEISHFEVVGTKEIVRSYYCPVAIGFSLLCTIGFVAGGMLLIR